MGKWGLLEKRKGARPSEEQEATSRAEEVAPGQAASLTYRAAGKVRSKGKVRQRDGLQGTIEHLGGQG